MSKKQTQNGAAQGAAPSISPSPESVLDWVRKDLQAAHYLLGIVLQSHPEIVEDMGKNVYETIMRKENGAGIDHVKQEKHAN